MPEGYETAFGTYDPCKKTLFINNKYSHDDILFIFTLFHELWHAKQYTYPEELDEDIRHSLNYVVLYNGICYKLQNNSWHKTTLTTQYDYENIYKSLPYEIDANLHAFFLAREYLPAEAIDTLNTILKKSKPTKVVDYPSLKKVFAEIDSMIIE